MTKIQDNTSRYRISTVAWLSKTKTDKSSFRDKNPHFQFELVVQEMASIVQIVYGVGR